MSSHKQKGPLTWRLPARLLMATLALAVVVLAGRDSKVSIIAKPYYAQAYCEPKCPETIVERPRQTPSRPWIEMWSWIREMTPRVLLLLLIVLLAGFAVGRHTATRPPTDAAVTAAIAGATAARVAEATAHSVAATATPMLIGASATTAVTGLLQPVGHGALIAGLSALSLFLLLLAVSAISPY
jgi:hypothetical protein